MTATGVQNSSAAFASSAGVENPIRVRLTTIAVTTILAVPAPGASNSNRKKVLYLRCAAATGAGTPTFTLDILAADGSTVHILRGNSALTAGEVYRETDILLMPGETLRGTASTEVDVTGSYLDFPRTSIST